MAVVTATRLNVSPLNDMPVIHRNYRVATAMLQGYVAIFDGSGYIVPTSTAPAAGVSIAGIAARRAEVGESLSLWQEGFLEGFDVSGLAYHALLYAGASGEIETTGNVIIGEVLPFGYGGEKKAYIDVRRSWMVA